jgi:tetratricopeptide (TPR) repeat protein
MNEQQLREIIAKGENESVDFKRELHIENPSQKAEFIKDIIALSNSTPDKGYLIIGIENNGNLFGIDALLEERIQQIAHTYIYPNVILKCYKIVLDKKLIGIVEINGTEKPHRVIKEIDRLVVNDVFIRHGSTTAKASPDEMFRMKKKETETDLEIQTLCLSAQKHIKLGNIDQAIVAYSKTIDLMPTSELLLSRGRARLTSFELDPNNYISGNLCVPVDTGMLALKDFSDALKLQESLAFEKEIRLARLELFSICQLDDPCWDADLVWAEENTNDNEYGRVLFFAALKIDIYSLYTGKGWDADKIIDFIDRAIELGYEDPKAYCLRASAHHSNQNLGLALKDVNFAYNMIRNDPRVLRECLKTRAGILKSMGEYELAYDDIQNAQKIDLPDNATADIDQLFLGDIHKLTDDIYQRIAIQWKLKPSLDGYLDIYKRILQILILYNGLPKYLSFIDDKTPREFSRGIMIEKEFPLLAPILKKIVGEDIWQAASKGRKFKINLKLDESDL